MILLNQNISVNIIPQTPYNFKGTVYKPSHFPSDTIKFIDETLYFSMNWKNLILGIKLYELPNSSISANIYSEFLLNHETINEIINEIVFRFNMQTDLVDFIRIASQEITIQPIELKYRGMHPSCAFSLYELLCITLVLQNAQVNRSVKMLEVMLHTFGKKVNFDNIILSSFWKPENLLESSEEYLRSLKIGYRAKSFLKVSDFFVDNPEFEFKLRNIPKSEAAKELQKIYGIGPASTWYLLFEKLHHYDAFDYVSPWELKILSMLIFGSMEKQSNEILNYANEKWGDKRMLAIHYIFEDVFWKRKNENIEWLNKLIRL